MPLNFQHQNLHAMSLNINPVNWVEIPTRDLNRAKSFYEHIFDIELQIQEFGDLKMAWLPSGENREGASGTLIENEKYIPSHEGTMIYFSVDDIPSTLDKVREQKCRVINDKMDIGEFGFVGHFEDSEGNRIGLHSDQ